VTVAQAAADADATPLRSEAPEVTVARVLAAVDALLAADDTRQRLRRVPDAGSVELKGSRGPAQI
jgi:hypothetical protein